MNSQSKEYIKKDNRQYQIDNNDIYKILFENNIYTPIPSFKQSIQKKKISNILNIFPSNSEQDNFKLPKNEKLNKILTKQIHLKNFALSLIKVNKK